MAPTINRKLNLVLPVEADSGKIWVHSVPISREVFESNYMLLTKTLSNLYMNGIGPAMAPRIAALVLRDTAKEINADNDISSNLIQEIYRLTNVLMPSTNGGGWQTIPYAEVKNKKLIDEQSLSEVENVIVYFIVASAVHLKNELQMAYQSLISLWIAQTTLLNVTEYGSSLTTSNQAANIGEKQTPKQSALKQSSIPS